MKKRKLMTDDQKATAIVCGFAIVAMVMFWGTVIYAISEYCS